MSRFDDLPRSDRFHELGEGEVLEGVVLRLPRYNAPSGSKLFLRVGGEVYSLRASARRGHTVLERQLQEKATVGDRIRIVYRGWRITLDGERRYRDYELTVL